MESDDWFSLAELTTRLGALVWVEERLAELLSAWSAIEAHAPSAIAFTTASGHHRWHGKIVRGCLPTSPDLDSEASIQAPTNGWRALVETMTSLESSDGTATRLKVLTRAVHPWLDRELGALRDVARPVSDAAMMRWLRFVSIDHYDDGTIMADLLAAHADQAVSFDDHALLSAIDLTR